ncbi:hypothetical protein EYF80_006107 [Liparis tanakae]|uniref:Uncharacterized protein n=1 Tax=Liparis tanakae TaxID=230148 RepID=A0A4Z2J062_9TELE|nr:hypothetical protein EYF80_006107 [Liparis tanakae]
MQGPDRRGIRKQGNRASGNIVIDLATALAVLKDASQHANTVSVKVRVSASSIMSGIRTEQHSSHASPPRNHLCSKPHHRPSDICRDESVLCFTI